MKILHVLLFCFVSVLWDGHVGVVTAKINVFPNAEGTNASVICSFGTSMDRKFFCRRECKDEDILVKTDGDTSQNGRYSVEYEHKSSQRAFLTVYITQLIKSDSGRYRCGLGGSLAPERYIDFDIKVTDASQSGNTDPAKKEVPVHRAVEGNDITVFCHFSVNKNPKFFCKNQCKDGDLLIQTSEVKAQKGRYTIKSEDGSAQNSIALFLIITQTTESDSGHYRCGLGSPSSPDNFREFEIRVGHDPTTSKPSFSTSVTKTTNQLTDPTTSEPSFSTSVTKTTNQLSDPTASKPGFSTSVTKTTNQLSAFSDVPRPVFFLPLVVCLPLVASLLAGFLLGLYIWRKRGNFELNGRVKADETAMESLLSPPLGSVETPPAVQP